MARIFRLFLNASRAVKVTCVLMIVISTPATFESIDEAMIKGDTKLSAFDTFDVGDNYTIDFKTDLDMLLPVEQFKQMYGTPVSEAARRSTINDDFKRWPNATMFYEIENKLQYASGVIQDAFDHWEKYTCMKFKKNNKPNRVKFVTGTGCRSFVGHLQRVQKLTLDTWCLKMPTVVHEIGHAIGFYHEHSRSDRDTYLTVVNTYTYSLNYLKATKDVSSYDVPYDYLSIMHYKGTGVFFTVDRTYQNRIGGSPGLSYGDIKQTNIIYDCAKLRAKCPEKACPFNGFVFYKAFKGQPACECFCDSGNQADPIIPCSLIVREFPGPNILGKSLQDIEYPDPCLDFRNDCDSLKSKGLCLSEPTAMLLSCTKTCGFCGKGTHLCMDNDSACKLMVKSCTDYQLKEVMSKLCRKTCKLCTGKSTACDIQQALSSSSESKASDHARPVNMSLGLLHMIACFVLVSPTYT